MREAIAVFLGPQNLKSAIRDLLASGVSRERIGLLGQHVNVYEIKTRSNT